MGTNDISRDMQVLSSNRKIPVLSTGDNANTTVVCCQYTQLKDKVLRLWKILKLMFQ